VGDTVPLVISGRLMDIDGMVCILFHLRDLTQEKANEAELQSSTERLEMAQGISNVGDFRWDVIKRTMSASKECARLFGIEQEVRDFRIADAFDLVHIDDHHHFKKIERGSCDIYFRRARPSDTVDWIHLIAHLVHDEKMKLVGISGTVQNVTARVQAQQQQEELQRQMLQTQKLESMGIMAGGIAHDFNNLLAAIMGNAELARESRHDPVEMIARIEVVISTAQRAAELTQQLLAYSGKGKFVIEPVNLNQLILGMGKLLSVSISNNIHIDYQLAPDLPNIEGDRAQVQQVIMNLIINASEALENNTGLIRIKTDVTNATLTGTANHVYLEIHDTGCGMDRETRDRLFEPFFTTKFTGRGLGMSAVLGIIRGHNGTIDVDSVPGRGTTFRLVFPCIDSPVAKDTTDTIELPQSPGNRTILIVDDEEAVRDMMSLMLTNAGHHTLIAEDGEKAIAIVEGNPLGIDLVILDLTMPNMNGQTTYRELRSINENIRVILMSGFSEQEASRQFGSEGIADFISKPFSYSDLISRVSSVLDSQSTF
jgi:two-component system, cell cycle sensor histidine kinase and response regulator CckA